jgi:hypothetical protein
MAKIALQAESRLQPENEYLTQDVPYARLNGSVVLDGADWRSQILHLDKSLQQQKKKLAITITNRKST